MRRILLLLLLSYSALVQLTMANEQQNANQSWEDRTTGMLLGSLLGDAMGGPLEFKSHQELCSFLPDLRNADAKAYRQFMERGTLDLQLDFPSYVRLRPEIAPYGPWEAKAPVGALTDDSRHKFVVLDCLRKGNTNHQLPTRTDLAQAYLDYFRGPQFSLAYQQLAKDSMLEYEQAARWILGQRDRAVALPPERIWAGVANCSGQMALLPISAVHAGNASAAYTHAYELGFMDTGVAKDLNCAIVAFLAAAIGSDAATPAARWQAAIEAMRKTDPFRYRDVPFVQRPTSEWFAFAIDAAQEANGSPQTLFQILESRGRAKYYWDAHFTFATAWAFLHFAEYDFNRAITVSLAFGHDTDSTAQLIGALCGAVHGTRIITPSQRETLETRLREDYNEHVDDWINVLRQHYLRQ